MEYWISTKSPAKMFRPARQTPELDAYFRETWGIDPAMLSAEIGMSIAHIKSYQRSLGLRATAANGALHALDHRGRKRVTEIV